MTATYDPNLRIALQGTGDNSTTWGQVLNQQDLTLLCQAIAGVATIDCTGVSNVDISATTVNGGYDQAREAVLELTGVLGANIQLIVPAVQKVYLIRFAQTGGYTISIKPVGGVASTPFAAGAFVLCYTNGTSIYTINGTGALLAQNNLSDLLNTSLARTNLGLGTAATLNVGTSANQVVQLNGSGKLPAVDGSLLVNVSATPAGLGSAAYLTAGTAAGDVVQLNGSAQLPAVDGSQLINLPNVNIGLNSYCVFTVAGSAVTIQRQSNIASVVRNSVGNYTITTTAAMPTNPLLSCSALGGSNNCVVGGVTLTATTYNFQTFQYNSGTLNDPATIMFYVLNN